VLLSVSKSAHPQIASTLVVLRRHHALRRGQTCTSFIPLFTCCDCWCRCGMYEVDVVRTPTDIGMYLVLQWSALPAALLASAACAYCVVGIALLCTMCIRSTGFSSMHGTCCALSCNRICILQLAVCAEDPGLGRGGLHDPSTCCTYSAWNAAGQHAHWRLSVCRQSAACMVQVKLSYGSYPELGAHTLQQIGQIVAREAER
jgi:hypothetical protein